MAVYTGTTFFTGFQGADGDVFIGCTFIATVTLGKGTVLKNCNFQCRPVWYGCSGETSKVGAGAVMDGGYASYVNFHRDGVWSVVARGPRVIAPSCVDCAPKLAYQPPVAPVDAMLITPHGFTTQAQWCAVACEPGVKGIIKHGTAAVAVAGKATS